MWSPGTDRANEIVILGAHLDSWDRGRRHRRRRVAIMMSVAI
jgi:hypothetical protein